MAQQISRSSSGWMRPNHAVMAGLCAVAMAGPVAAVGETTSREAEALFESKVRPLLVARCHECHGATMAEAGLRLDSRKALLQGSDSGAVVVPGKAAESRLLAAVKHQSDLAMPPDAKLSAEEIATLEQWVSIGLPWTGSGGEASGPATREEAMQERLHAALASHWAFRPPQRHTPGDLSEIPALEPAVAAAWKSSPIDRFIATELVAAGLAPSPPASPRDLYRRLCYDLTGLPPSAADADAFAADPSETAYRNSVERMLASREHAEHWARHWLDLARYADTIGYAFGGQSPLYPFAWTYRDWVVKALHDDVPYDRFVTLQLAADRVEPAVPQADLAALGFLTVGRTFLGNTHDIIDDRIDLVTRGLLGLTVGCARCHDHKYEPISSADYYALYGVFASCEMPAELPVIGNPPAGPDAEAFAARLTELEAKVAAHEEKVHVRAVREAVAHAADYFLETARPAARPDGRPPQLADGYEMEQLLIDRLKRLLGGAKENHPILGPWASVQSLPDDELGPRLAAIVARWSQPPAAEPGPDGINPLVAAELASVTPSSLRQLADAYARLIARVAPAFAGGPAQTADEPAELVALRALLGLESTPLVVPRSEAMRVAKRSEGEEMRRLKQAITKHQAESPGGPPRAMVLLDRQNPVDSHVFLRGNPGRPGPKINRRLPELLGGAPLDRGSSGRLDLARQIVSAENPLTARVLVNWVWTHHFGRGIVATPGDLGLRGESPSHPALLDDLARRFIEEGGFSLRWLHREIVLSQTWRQSATLRPELAARDPDNRLFGRAERRRLSWEAWRDSLLIAAGVLDPSRFGGPGINPLETGAMTSRTVYARLDRQDVPGLLRTFDVANPDTAVHVRSRTTVPQQGLAVLNAPLVVETAKRLAARTVRAAGTDAANSARITALWRYALARSPTEREQVMAHAWLGEAEAASPQAGFGPWERLAQALLATAEFQFVD
jgi:hypothetical protein